MPAGNPAAALVGEGRRQDLVNRRRGRRVAGDPAAVRPGGRVRLGANSGSARICRLHGGRGAALAGAAVAAGAGQGGELDGRGLGEDDARWQSWVSFRVSRPRAGPNAAGIGGACLIAA